MLSMSKIWACSGATVLVKEANSFEAHCSANRLSKASTSKSSDACNIEAKRGNILALLALLGFKIFWYSWVKVWRKVP